MKEKELIGNLEVKIKRFIEKFKKLENKEYSLQKENEELKNKLLILRSEIQRLKSDETNVANEGETERLKEKYKVVKAELGQLKKIIGEILD